MTRRDYETYDYLIAMDRNNLRNMVRFVGSDPEHNVSLLMDHTSRPGDVADPWYTGEFEATWQDVPEGCTALPEELRSKGKGMTKRYCKGERFADLSFAGEVFDRINLLTWCENGLILSPTQGREHRQMKHTADARHILPGRMRCSQTNFRQTD